MPCVSTGGTKDPLAKSLREPARKRMGGKECQKLHHELLHGTTVSYVNTMSSKKKSNEPITRPNQVFLHIFSHVFPNKNMSLVLFTDDGSDCSLITEAAAGYLGLRSKTQVITLQAGTKEPETKRMNVYSLDLPLLDGSRKVVTLLGVDRITENTSCHTDVGGNRQETGR